ncbi:MAG: ankyrin repeat domain-containing protein [Planctomycetaceae bacterium]|jgi:ankyrin repeat protein|nr:ankyrin repeat domain-containing protein [Planctomycetaceae bacterium]
MKKSFLILLFCGIAFSVAISFEQHLSGQVADSPSVKNTAKESVTGESVPIAQDARKLTNQLFDELKGECRLEEVKRLVELGANVKPRYESFRNILSTTITSPKYNLPVLKYLIEKGAADNGWFAGGSPLVDAISAKNFPAVKLLVEAGIDVNSRYSQDRFPLFAAIESPYKTTEILQYLLDNSAEIEPDGGFYRSPLLKAVALGNFDFVKFLVDRGANVTITEYYGDNILHHAAYYEPTLEIIKLLVEKGADVKAKNHDGRTPLYNFLITPQTDEKLKIIKYLIDKGENINERNYDGMLPIQTLVDSGLWRTNHATLKYLITNGEKVDWSKDSEIHANPISAAAQRNLATFEVVKYFVENGASLSDVDQEGQTPLHRVVQQKDADPVTVLYMVAKGAKVDAKDYQHYEPLHLAFTQSGGIGIAKILIENGANLNSRCKWSEQTPFHHAVASPYTNLDDLHYLYRKSANINATDSSNQTAVHFAAKSNNDVNVIKYLIGTGGNVKAVDKKNQTPLHLAAANNKNLDILKYLIEKDSASVNAKDTSGETPLFAAIRAKNFDVVKLLVDSGANINVSNTHYGHTPLMLAVSFQCDIEVIKYLIDKGADVNAKDKDGQDVLFLELNKSGSSQRYTDPKIVKLLVDSKVKLNEQDKNGLTPIVFLLTRYNFRRETRELTRYLIEHGADVNIKDKNNLSLLQLLVQRECSLDSDILKLLINNSKKIDWSTKQTQNPILWAINKQIFDVDVIKYFVENGADINQKNPNSPGINYGQLSKSYQIDKRVFKVLCKYLVEKGMSTDELLNILSHLYPHDSFDIELAEFMLSMIDVNKTTQSGNSMISYAVQAKNLELVKYLVDRGADINLTTKYGNSLINQAVASGSIEIVKYLADRKVDVKKKNNNGLTPFYFAYRSGSHANIDIVKFLIRNGCDPKEVDKDGNTVLHHIFAENADKQVELLNFLCVECGLDINKKNNDGKTPINYKINGMMSEKVLKRFIELGADVNAPDNLGLTPLHYVTRRTALGDHHNTNTGCMTMKLLIDNGANINSPDKNGMTPIHLATMSSFYMCIEADLADELDPMVIYLKAKPIALLIKRGADINIPNKEGKTAKDFILTPFYNQHHVLQQLIRECNFDVKISNDNKQTFLHLLAKRCATAEPSQYKSTLKFVKFLLDHGVPVNSKDKFGLTPLHYVAGAEITGQWHVNKQKAASTMIQYLIKNGADVNAKDNNNTTPLHEVIKNKMDFKTIKLLITNGANVNEKDKDGSTPLHFAVGNISAFEISGFLLAFGADVNAKDKNNATPLHNAAAQNATYKTIKLLIEFGADIDAKDIHGKKPVDILKSDDKDKIELLTGRK